MDAVAAIGRRAFVALTAGALAARPGEAGGAPERLRVSPSGHFFAWRGRTRMLIGDSGTQVALMNGRLDARAWIDACQREGHSTVHVWSFTGPRPGDWRLGSAPALLPWARRAAGGWDLLRWDDAPNGYWSRLRSLCAHARERGLLVGITFGFGWCKAGGPSPGLRLHPFHRDAGGFAETETDIVGLWAAGEELHAQPWDAAWPPRRKSQWLWERLALRFLETVGGLGNVWFDYRDEWSYANAAAAESQAHWRRFFRSRGALWADRSGEADFRVANPDVPDWGPTPAMKTEGEPYDPEGVRADVWSRTMGGVHYLLHSDAREPNVAAWDAEVAPVRGQDPRDDPARRFVGLCSRFWNEHVPELDALERRPELVRGGGRCMASERVAAAWWPAGGGAVEVDLRGMRGRVRSVWYDPRTGRKQAGPRLEAGGWRRLERPDSRDWTLLLDGRAA